MIKAILVEIIWRGLSTIATATIDLIKKIKKKKEDQQKAEDYENANGKDDASDTFGDMP